MKPRFEIYKGYDSQWYWRLKASNGQTVAQGEGYTTVGAAKIGVDTVRKLASDPEVEVRMR